MITVKEAEEIIQNNLRDYGTELISFNDSLGRVLAENIYADRDMPPFNRATMDGIAINYTGYKKGVKEFQITGTQAAGNPSIPILNDSDCIEIMTGAALDNSVDTVIRYEDVKIDNDKATILADTIQCFQSIHKRGIDKQSGELLVSANQKVTPTIISILASVGKHQVSVKKLPKVVIISSGDELVDVQDTPKNWEIRRSNNYTLHSVLEQYLIKADMLHLADDPEQINSILQDCFKKYDVILMSGAVSMGKYDHIPEALHKLGVKKEFHHVKQRPGKPFYFGSLNKVLIFAFPGNPVSTFFCLYRYFIPWLQSTLGLPLPEPIRAKLNIDINFHAALDYFVASAITIDHTACLIATPAEGNGSGDFVNLLNTQAFIELPAEQNNFVKGMIVRIWPYSPIF